MEALERIEAKLDLIMQRLQVEDTTQETQVDSKPVRRRTRRTDEISNSTMSGLLNVPYIGNKDFCRVAEAAGLQVIKHGTHPYIKKACIDLWVEMYKKVMPWKGEE